MKIILISDSALVVTKQQHRKICKLTDHWLAVHNIIKLPVNLICSISTICAQICYTHLSRNA